MTKDNALSFVGQIMTAYKAVMKADSTALEQAIECGKYLALAKENVEAARPKRKWSAWLAEHCPEIHQNTAALYMRLADPDNADAIAECTSIRHADVVLRQPRKRKQESHDEDSEESHDEDADDKDDNSQRVVKRRDVSPDLTSTLLNVDVDEVCRALIDAWDEDHIRQLCDRLHAHFTKPKEDLNTPAQYRRAPSVPAAQPN
jgi:hypothetical protein